MEIAVEKLIEDYSRRINNANQLLAELRKGKSSDRETRLVAKISVWRTFIGELNQILQNG